MKALVALVLLLASLSVLADDLHIVRPDRVDTFRGCVTTRLYITANQAHLSMFCPAPPVAGKARPATSKPDASMAWDWYVSDAHRVWAGEDCRVRAHFQGAYSAGAVTELECGS